MKFFEKTIFILFLFIFIGSAWMFFSELLSQHQSIQSFDQLSELVKEDENKAPLPEQVISVATTHNEDMVAWLHIAGTPIDYPVMYTPHDPEYYLRRNFEKQQAQAGTPFLSEGTLLNPLSTNLIIYSHNMSNNTMFGSLPEYSDRAYMDEHPTITLTLQDEVIEYEVFAAFAVDLDNPEHFPFYSLINETSEQHYNEYIEGVQSVNLHNHIEVPQASQSLLTLVCCDYNSENGRFIVIAKQKGASN